MTWNEHGNWHSNDESNRLNQIQSAAEEAAANEYAAERARQIRAAKERVINGMTVAQLEALDEKIVADKKKYKKESDAISTKIFAAFFLFLSLCSFIPGNKLSWTAHIGWVIVGILCLLALFHTDNE
jgi:hypothetical protein